MLSKTSVWRYFDVWLFAAVLLLTAYGIVMIRSAVTGAPALEPLPADQVRWAILGVILLLGVAAIDYRIFHVGPLVYLRLPRLSAGRGGCRRPVGQ